MNNASIARHPFSTTKCAYATGGMKTRLAICQSSIDPIPVRRDHPYQNDTLPLSLLTMNNVQSTIIIIFSAIRISSCFICPTYPVVDSAERIRGSLRRSGARLDVGHCASCPSSDDLAEADDYCLEFPIRLFPPSRRKFFRAISAYCMGYVEWSMLSTRVFGQSDLQGSLSPLESRLEQNSLDPPPYGMEGTDVYYPSWFEGKWSVISTCMDVQAPCGVALFGGNRTYASAKREIGLSTEYESRFLRINRGSESSDCCMIADREFNVQSIARATMGSNSVLDVPLATPNRFTCILAPMGSPDVLQVDLITLKRRQDEQINPMIFNCAEVARQIVGPGGRSASQASRLKEIETISLYTYDSQKSDRITCRQRSATYLLPSQQDPVALRMWQASQGRPVDIRFYDVVYTKR